MPVTTRIHAVLTEAEQLAIVNALAFYNAQHTFPSHEWDEDEREQWRIAFREDNRGSDREGPIDQLATRIANLK